jgi:hypothetical protein
VVVAVVVVAVMHAAVVVVLALVHHHHILVSILPTMAEASATIISQFGMVYNGTYSHVTDSQ